MNRRLVFAAAMLGWMSGPGSLHAQTDHLVSFDTGRTAGGAPVQMRAILSKPAKATDTAVLFFRGVPGYARIQGVTDRNRNLLPFMRASLPLFLQAGLALVIMDCPTDQWGSPGDILPSACLDDYRSSKTHVDDVRGVMARLREEHGITRFYLLGHSQGTISSRWLALNLGSEIAGSVHSAAVNVANPKGQYASVRNFPYERILTPMLHVHHEQDACRGTPYAIVKAYAGNRLTTVRGGNPQGDPCGGQHLHSYMGMEEPVGRAIVQWIRSGTLQALVE